MSCDWRSWSLTTSVLIAVGGAALGAATGNPATSILGALAAVTSCFERSYGAPTRARSNTGMRPTDERFVDPETGHLVTVWYDPATGERRYVADGEAS